VKYLSFQRWEILQSQKPLLQNDSLERVEKIDGYLPA